MDYVDYDYSTVIPVDLMTLIITNRWYDFVKNLEQINISYFAATCYLDF